MQDIEQTKLNNEDKKYKKKKSNSFWVRNSYNTNDWWKPGQPVTDEDLRLLQRVRDFYEENEYSPTKEDLDDKEYVIELKSRFRTWDNILLAAGLPRRNDPEQVKKRKEALNLKE